ncbi:transcriptional regulator [Planctomycetales bacterium]|nr:transcriptional regulator [Planctomycetales bacterium]
MPARKLYAAIDIGGTKVSVLLVDENYRVVARGKKKTRPDKGFNGVLERVKECLAETAATAKLSVNGLQLAGVAVPSPVLPTGVAVNAPNMGWRNAPVTKSLEKLLGVPVVTENDGNTGAYGEYALGAGKKAAAQLLIGFFIGTGLGGGIVYHGDLMRGVNYQAAEVGHTIVEVNGRRCGCGKRGCLEAYASKTGMGYYLKQQIICEKRASVLTELCAGGNYDNVRSGILLEAYEAGDAVTVEAVTEAARYMGIGIGNIITLLGPDMVVLGGGVFAALGKEMLPIIKEAAKSATHPASSFRDTKILPAALGDDSVALGALAYARATTKQ